MSIRTLAAWAALAAPGCAALAAEPLRTMFLNHAGEIRLREVAWQPLPKAVIAVFVGPDGRIWYQLRHPARKEKLDVVRRVIEREFRKKSPQLYGAQPVLFEPGGRVWFRTHSQSTLLAYDGKAWIVHPSPGELWTIGNCPGHGRFYGAGYNCIVAGKLFFVGCQGIEWFDGKAWQYLGMVDKWPGTGNYPRLAPEPDGKSVLSYLPNRLSPVWRWRDGRWEKLDVSAALEGQKLSAVAPRAKGELWLFRGDGRMVRWNAAARDALGVAALLEKLGSDSYQERERATADLIRLGVAIQAPAEAALAKTDDPEVILRLRRVLKGIHPDATPRTAIGRYHVRKALLRLHDPVDHAVYIAGEVETPEGHVGLGLLVVDAKGEARFYCGSAFAHPWPSLVYSVGGDLVVRRGRRMWLAGARQTLAGMLLDLERGVVCKVPDPNYSWFHAALPDGTVFLSQSGRHHDGIVAFRPSFAAPPR